MSRRHLCICPRSPVLCMVGGGQFLRAAHPDPAAWPSLRCQAWLLSRPPLLEQAAEGACRLKASFVREVSPNRWNRPLPRDASQRSPRAHRGLGAKAQPVRTIHRKQFLLTAGPGPPARAVPAAGQLEETQGEGGAGPVGFADRCCKGHGKDWGRWKHEGGPEWTHLCALEHESPQISHLLQGEGWPAWVWVQADVITRRSCWAESLCLPGPHRSLTGPHLGHLHSRCHLFNDITKHRAVRQALAEVLG